jgi:hypothetical protein
MFAISKEEKKINSEAYGIFHHSLILICPLQVYNFNGKQQQQQQQKIIFCSTPSFLYRKRKSFTQILKFSFCAKKILQN